MEDVNQERRNLLEEVLVTSSMEEASCSFDVGVATCTAVEDVVDHTFTTNQGPSSLAM